MTLSLAVNAKASAAFRKATAAINSAERKQLRAKLRSQAKAGKTLRQCETALRKAKSTLARVVGPGVFRRGLSPEKRAVVLRRLGRGESTRRAASGICTRHTAWRYRRKQTLELLGQDAPLPCAAWRCPIGGERLNVTVCIAHGVTRDEAAAGTK